jgi:hypothetical protein
MKISPAHGGVRVRLDAGESDALTSLLTDLVDTLRPGGLDHDDPVFRRLFPDGYQDNPEAAEAFRSLTEGSLRQERLERAERCLAGLAALEPVKRRVDVQLDAEAAQRWTQVLNDMRLAVGTRLGITDEDAPYDFDPRDPASMPWAVYAYLTGMQDSLVRALMR